MIVTKEVSENNELFVYMNGKLIYKRWLNTGQSKVFDLMAYDKYTLASYTDLDINKSSFLIHSRAKVRFNTCEEGGRKLGVYSGYRPDHVFEKDEGGNFVEAFGGDIQFDQFNVLELGEWYEVLVRFRIIGRIEKFMKKGMKWSMHEGKTKVGDGEIIEFISTDETSK